LLLSWATTAGIVVDVSSDKRASVNRRVGRYRALSQRPAVSDAGSGLIRHILPDWDRELAATCGAITIKLLRRRCWDSGAAPTAVHCEMARRVAASAADLRLQREPHVPSWTANRAPMDPKLPCTTWRSVPHNPTPLAHSFRRHRAAVALRLPRCPGSPQGPTLLLLPPSATSRCRCPRLRR
jgi:hypothetical protein